MEKEVGRPTFEFVMNKFVAELRSSVGSENRLGNVVMPGMVRLVEAFVRESLEPCSDVSFNATLAKSLIAIEDFNDLDGAANEYLIRKHMRSIIRAYASEVNKARPIGIKDITTGTFGIHFESIGLNIGFSADSRGHGDSRSADGNVIVMTALTLSIVVLVFIAYMNRANLK